MRLDSASEPPRAQRGAVRLGDGGTLGLAHLPGQLLLQRDQLADRRHGRLDGAQQIRLAHLARAALDHHDRFARARDHQFHLRVFALGEGRIDQVAPSDLGHANRAHRAGERDVGDGHRGGCRHDAQHVRVIGLVRREHRDHDLELVGEVLGEERAKRPIDQPGTQDFLLVRPSFALEESSRDLPRRVELGPVVHGERDEILPGKRPRAPHRTGQHHGVPELHRHGAAGLPRHPSLLDCQCTRAQRHRFSHDHLHSSPIRDNVISFPDATPCHFLDATPPRHLRRATTRAPAPRESAPRAPAPRSGYRRRPSSFTTSR